MDQKVDGVFRTRTLGVAACGIPDQYADGTAAKLWQKYIGDQKERTQFYKEKLIEILNEHKCKNVFDVACGTGVDSIMLVESGFNVTSCDASDKMLKYALKLRWERRKEKEFDNWVIEEGNWLSLSEACIDKPEDGFDALICMGNSFAHLPDFDGTQEVHFTAIKNFHDMLKPGGVLIIDHRNYDHIVKGNKAPMKNIYYKSSSDVSCKTSVLMVDGKYRMVTLDYSMHFGGSDDEGEFRLSYYPHLLHRFNEILEEVFTKEANHKVLADFQELDQVDIPSYYIHIIQKQ